MAVRILGGFAKSFSIETPQHNATRPTSVMLKRKIFDFFQDLSDYDFYDLCAGSGSIGLEAASRGAKKVIFVENHIKTFDTLKRNIRNFQNKFNLSNCSYLKKDILNYLKKDFLSSATQSEVFFYFDPPYENKTMYRDFMEILNSTGVKIRGVVAIEACTQKTMKLDDFESLYGKFDKIYKQGTNFLGIYYLPISDIK